MALRDEVIATLVEAVTALNRRVGELPLPQRGPQGERGPAGPKGADASIEQIRDVAESWLAQNITQPNDGKSVDFSDVAKEIRAVMEQMRDEEIREIKATLGEAGDKWYNRDFQRRRS